MKTILSVVSLILLHWTVYALAGRPVHAQSPVVLTLDLLNAGPSIPKDFVGLSFEMEKVLPDREGQYYFTPSNRALIAMVKSLGIKSLRVGGNTADRPSVRVPAENDVDELFSFARAAGVKVIYTVRLRGGDPRQAAQIAKYITQRYPNELECFAIGNEPNVFTQDYQAYLKEWRRYVSVMTSPQNAPDAKFCGPGSTPGKASWSADFAQDVGRSGLLKFISQHAYPGGNGARVVSPAAGQDSMLSASWVRSYGVFAETFVPAVRQSGLSYRLEETNNFYNAGAPGVSDVFASALWGLDYLHWWASRGAAGLNIHTGDSVAAGEATNPCRYAVFTTSSEGFTVRPLGYALKAFGLGGGGVSMPTRLTENGDGLNLTAYTTQSINGAVHVTIINKEYGSQGRSGRVTLKTGSSFDKAEMLTLSAPDGTLAAVSGVRLGGDVIRDDGSWHGIRVPLEQRDGDGFFVIDVPAATAVLIRLSVR